MMTDTGVATAAADPIGSTVQAEHYTVQRVIGPIDEIADRGTSDLSGNWSPLEEQRHRVSIPRKLPPIRPAKFVLHEMWEGVVEEILDSTFVAQLMSLTRPDAESECAEILKSEVSLPDLPLLHEGSLFIWWIGYEDLPSGRRRTSIIRFRRLPSLPADAGKSWVNAVRNSWLALPE